MRTKILMIVILVISSSTIFAQVTWSGAGTTRNYNLATNWVGGVTPTSGNDVVIPTVSSGFYPNLTGAATCVNITFNGNGHLNFNTPAITLTVNGNFTNNTGNTNILDNKGIVNFRGAGNTTITNSTNFNVLIVQKTVGAATVSLAGSTNICTINDRIRPATGTFVVGAGFDLILNAVLDPLSGVEKTAYVDGYLTTGNITGNVTVQNYVYEVLKNYHIMCSPIVDAEPLDLEDNISTGSVYNGSYAYPAGPTIPDWITYDETVADPVGSDFYYGWEGIGSSTYVFAAMEGYYLRFAPNTDQLINWKGVVNNGNITSPTLSYTNNSEPVNDGFNQLGNPYPSPFNYPAWWSANGSSTTLNPFMGVFQTDGGEYTGGYLIWNEDPNLTTFDGIVDIGQGFMVQSTSNGGNITLTNDYRVGGSPTFLKTDNVINNESNSFGLKLSGQGNNDITFVKLGEDYSFNYNGKNDITKLINPANSIYTLKPEGRLTVNKLPFPVEAILIPLEIKTEKGGKYTLEAKKFGMDIKTYPVYLEDKLMKVMLPVTSDFNYSFEASEDVNSNRFVLHVNNASKTESVAVSEMICFIDRSNLNMQLPNTPVTNAQVLLTDLSGKVLVNNNISLSGGKAIMDIATLPAGMYLVNVTTASSSVTQKVVYSK